MRECVCVCVERLNENLRAVTERILGLFVHRSNKIIMSNTTHSYTKLLLPMAYISVRDREYFSFDTLSLFLFLFLASMLLHFNVSIDVPKNDDDGYAISPIFTHPFQRKTSITNINFYSPCDKCYMRCVM